MQEPRARRLNAIITGRVQGVAFRWYTVEKAEELGLVGWVRNLPDGTVELLAEGMRDKLDKLLEWCHAGPPTARVNDVRIEFGEATGDFTEFGIRH